MAGQISSFFVVVCLCARFTSLLSEMNKTLNNLQKRQEISTQ